MGFYDSYDFSGFKVLSKIKDYPSISEPCAEFINLILNRKNSGGGGGELSVAEIGIGYGATTLATCLQLFKDDTYYIFDFESKIIDMIDDLNRIFEVKCKVVGVGNSNKDWDSYNWNLSTMLLQMRSLDEDGIFDVVYLDGVHTFLHDGLAVCMLKEMIKPNGILILDDLFWTHEKDPWVSDKFTEEQLKAQQILRVQDIFLTNDPNFKRLSDSKSWRGIFKRI